MNRAHWELASLQATEGASVKALDEAGLRYAVEMARFGLLMAAHRGR